MQNLQLDNEPADLHHHQLTPNKNKNKNKQTLVEKIKKNMDKKCGGDKPNNFFRKKSIKMSGKFSGNTINKNPSNDLIDPIKLNDDKLNAIIVTDTNNPNDDEINVDNENTVSSTVKNNKSSPNKSNSNIKLSYNNLIASLLRTTTL